MALPEVTRFALERYHRTMRLSYVRQRVPPDPPHPLEAELRALLGPTRGLVSVALQGRLALTRDGVVWRVADGGDAGLVLSPVHVPAPPGEAAAVVDRLWSTQVWTSVHQAQVAVLRSDGALLVAGNLFGGGCEPLDGERHPILHPPAFVHVDLQGERVVEVFLTPRQGHVLTHSVPRDKGSIWLWGDPVEVLGVTLVPASTVARIPVTAPIRVTAENAGAQAPDFRGLSVGPMGNTMCAFDHTGDLYAAGSLIQVQCFRSGLYGGSARLVRLPRAPSPVRQVLATGGFENGNRLRMDGTGRGVEVHAESPEDRMIARLEDGTLWGLTLQRRLQGAGGVRHVRAVGAGVRLLTWGGQDLPFRPAEAQMRAHFAAVPGQLVQTVCSGLYALTADGRVWRAGAEEPRQLPVPGAAAVDAIWGRDSSPPSSSEACDLYPDVAVRRAQDGALLLADHPSDPGQLPQLHEIDLRGERIVQVFMTPLFQYHALTVQGSICVFGRGGNSLLGSGGRMVVIGKPVRLEAMGEEPAAEPPRFTQLSVDPCGVVLCALDQEGALFACGPMFKSPTGGWARPIRLAAPPCPVRQVFAAHAGAGPDGVLAVLQDGTVWSVTRRERLLPGVSDVQGLRWEGHTVHLILENGREVPLPDLCAAASHSAPDGKRGPPDDGADVFPKRRRAVCPGTPGTRGLDGAPVCFHPWPSVRRAP